jgi:hypothetical protein
MAQDFSDLFEVGDGKVIMAVDVFGVMLASVQALARRVKELEAGRV